MNKVVCYVCGTSYPESASQCPICGYVQTAENAASSNSGENGYTYVKGGRFSKSNVKKRNQASTKVAPVHGKDKQKRTSGSNSKSNVWSVVLIIVLLLAIVSVAGYITLRFFLPNDFMFEGLDNLTFFAQKQENEDSEPEMTSVPMPDETAEPTEISVSLNCTGVSLSANIVQLTEAESTHQLVVTLEPADTLDPVSYISSDETVATVNSEGMITAVGNGTAIITVTCGSTSAQCTVNCDIPEEMILELNRKEITFNIEGQSWTLYNGQIPMEDIVWTSEDNSIATIDNGKVTAVANGDTTVFAAYNDQTVSCVIHCKFEEDPAETSNVSEAEGSSGKSYMLYNPYGYADDVTINVGDQFILKLVDANMENAENVQWSVKNESVCQISDNTVTAIGSGVTEVTATCEGKTYTCVVRVN